MNFTFTTAGRDKLGLAESCQRHADELWVPAHICVLTNSNLRWPLLKLLRARSCSTRTNRAGYSLQAATVFSDSLLGMLIETAAACHCLLRLAAGVIDTRKQRFRRSCRGL